ncbi:MAG: hypothetical protein HY925_02160 [Elusimicrobia bacterium]|nr:hypothetical protein [Elusimicrobiota bacterium]
MLPGTVNCPNCRVPFQMWEPKCLNCGIDILETLERKARESQEKAEALAEGRSAAQRRKWRKEAPRRPIRLYAALGAAAFSLVIAWLLQPAPLPKGAVADPSGLVFIAPEGWSVETKLGEGWRFQGIARLTAPDARIEVESAPATLPLGEHLESLVLEEFNGRRPQVGTAGKMQAGGVEGKRVSFSVAANGSEPPTEGEAVFVPGSSRNYLLRFYASGPEAGRRRADWTALLDSIRLGGTRWASFLSRR